jgi:predicted ATPase
LEEAMEGKGGAVAVEGEAGVGKTRLVEEFLGYARSRGAHVLSGCCYERELGPPLEPVTDALGPLAAEDRMADMLEEDYGHKTETDGDVRIYGSLFRKLIRLSREAGETLVLFVDDVQWADLATLEFLAYAARRILGQRVLLIFTYRREDAMGFSEWLNRLAEQRTVTTLSLARLLEQDTTELVEPMASRSFEGLPALSDFLYQESEGNPFYAVEYLRWLIEVGIVRVDSRRRICALEGEPQNDALPSGVRSLIQARIGGLDGEARDLLKLAAVIGRTFDLLLLRKLASRGQAGTFETIDLLLASGLVARDPGGTYHFSHDKLRQAPYEGIGDLERQELHLRVAEALEELDGEPADLAHHYLRAWLWRPALENLVQTARKAQESYAWETALDSYTRALEIVDELPDAGETRFELLLAREQLLEYAGR